MRTSLLWQLPAVTLGLLLVVGCDGEDSDNCRIIETNEGSSTIRCPDGSQADILHGEEGAPGTPGPDGGPHPDSCSLTDNADGSGTLKCGEHELLVHYDCPDGFPGDLVIGDGYYLDNNSELTSLAYQLAGCTEVQGALIVDGFAGSTPPSFISRIERVGGDLIVGFEMGNENLTSVSFPLLRSVGGTLTINGNFSLTHIGDFSALEKAQTIDISRNLALEELGAFPALEEVGAIFVSWNNALLRMNGLFSIARITESATIDANCSLRDDPNADTWALTEAHEWAIDALVPAPDDSNFYIENNGDPDYCY